MKYKLLFTALVIITGVIYLAGYLWFKNVRLVMDERFHFDQIVRFSKGDFSLHPALAMGPGYHLFMGAIANIFNLNSFAGIRLANLLLNLTAVPVFYITARKLNPKTAGIKTLWFLVFPINFLHFLMVYSDIFSCMLVIASFYLVTERQYLPAGLVGAVSMLVRQTNVVWYFFLYLLAYLQEYGWKWKLNPVLRHLKKTRVYLAGFLLFFVFLIVNKGITVGTGAKGFAPVIFNLNNLYFLLFIFFFLFLPSNLAKFKTTVQMVRKNKLIIIGLIFFYLLFLATFYNTHPWNQADYFIRNKILTWGVTNNFTKSMFFIPMAYSLLSLLATKLYDKNYLFIYPAILILVTPMWLVEPRYYLIFFSLFFLLEKSISPKTLYLSAVYSLLISPYIFYQTAAGWFYP